MAELVWRVPSVEEFRHQGLGEAQIRLLHVYCNSSGLLEAVLVHFDLEHTPSYKALSYTWGNKNLVESICMNGRRLSLRGNLFAFLQVYKSRHLGEWLWVDQICINQMDVAERNKQVQLMSRIYRGADQVIAWLNDQELQFNTYISYGKLVDRACDDECSRNHHRQDVMDTPAKLPENNRPWLDRTESHSQETELDISKIGPTSHDSGICTFLRNMYNHSFWKRVWIVQEVLLARSLVVWFGAATFSWEEVQLYPKPSDTAVSLYFLTTMSLKFRQGPLRLLDALQAFCFQLCEDPHDHVFGLQAIVREDHKILADYSLSTTEAFAVVIARVIRTEPHFGPNKLISQEGLIILGAAMQIPASVYHEDHGGPFGYRMTDPVVHLAAVYNASQSIPGSQLSEKQLIQGTTLMLASDKKMPEQEKERTSFAQWIAARRFAMGLNEAEWNTLLQPS